MDPTIDEMRDYLTERSFNDGEDDTFEIEDAIYWFAANYHGGQWSNLYAALSASEFRPSPLSNGPDEGMASLYYESLVQHFAAEVRS